MLQVGSLIRDLSVRELIAMVASLYPRPLGVDETIALTRIEEIADRRTQNLSGGETQRARFAVALVSNPDLLVLDEPTVAMDVESRRAFWTTMRDFAARGKTVLFATHYLEEADAYADRAVLMAHGRVVADGPPTEIKAMVGQRHIRATLPDVQPAELETLAGVTRAERRGESVVLTCSDSDAAIRELLARFPQARDIEIAGAGLEEAFVELTGVRGARVKLRDVHQLRAAADGAQQALHDPRARLPARPLLPHRRAEPARAEPRRVGHLSAAVPAWSGSSRSAR